MRLTKRRGYELLTTGTAVSLPAAATGQSQSAIFTPVDIAQWTLDSQGNALVKLHDGSIQSLTGGSFKIVRGRLVPITRDDEPALDVPGNDQPVTTGDLEELGVFELSQFGWYSAGAGGVAGIVAVIMNSSDANSENLTVEEAVENYGDHFSAFGTTRVITGTNNRDELTFGAYAAGYSGDLAINLLDGDDVVVFSDKAAYELGSVSIIGGDGDKSYSFEDEAGVSDGKVSITGGAGDQSYIFEGNAGEGSGSVSITGGDGDQSYSFEENAGGSTGSVSITGGDGDQSYSFGDEAGYKGSVSITGGDGDQSYSFGDYAAGDSFFGGGSVSITGGTGVSSYTFGDNAGRYGGNITLDLVADTFNDTIVFAGSVANIFIQNYSIIYDDKVDVVVPSTWSGTDNGSDIVFTQSDQTITFEGLGGLGGSTDPLDYFM